MEQQFSASLEAVIMATQDVVPPVVSTLYFFVPAFMSVLVIRVLDVVGGKTYTIVG